MPQQYREAGPDETDVTRLLAVALQTVAAYPRGHPVPTRAIGNAHQRLAELLAAAGHLAIGVGRDALLFGDVKLQTPQARKLAQALYQRDVALVRITPGFRAFDLEALLDLLTTESRSNEPSPLGDELAAVGAQHIVLEPVDYASIRMTDEVRVDDGPASPGEPASLWDAILRVLRDRPQPGNGPGPGWSRIFHDFLRAGEEGGSEGTGPGTTTPETELATMVAEYLRQTGPMAPGEEGRPPATAARLADGEAVAGTGPARDAQADALLSTALAAGVGSYLATARGPARDLAVRQTVHLVRALPGQMREVVLHSAVRTLAVDETAAEPLRTLSASIGPDEILRTLRRLRAEDTKLSRHALLLAKTLSAPAGRSARAGSAILAPDEAIIAEMLALFQDEDIDRFNPEDHQALFERLAIGLPELAPVPPRTPADLGERIDSLDDDHLAEQLGQTVLEVLGRHAGQEGTDALLTRIETLLRLFLTRGRIEPAADLVEATSLLAQDPLLPPGARGRMRDSLGRMADPETLAALVEGLPSLTDPFTAGLRRLFTVLDRPAIGNLLVALAEEPSRSRRRRLFDLLVALGPMAVEGATARLSDPRWYVVRNMVALLRSVGDRSSLSKVRPLASHPDLRVRLEAIRSFLALDVHAGRDLLQAVINDRDPKVAAAAMTLAETDGSVEALEPLVWLLTRWDLLGRRRAVRLRALRALGTLASPDVLPRLARFFRNWLIPVVALDERRVAFQTLAAYPAAASRPWLERGLRARDPVIRDICRRLSRLDGSA